MDPNANLEEQRALAGRLLRHDDDRTDFERLEDAERLALLVIELNEWLERGGFMPDRWLPEALRR